MKTAYTTLYWLSGIIFLIAVLGSSLTKGFFDSLSEKTLGAAGVNRSYFNVVDDKIDELIYRTKQIELQIERIKKIFTPDEVDERKYQREKNAMLESAIYNPLIQMFNYLYRIGFILISFIILSFAVIFHLLNRSLELRRRVRRLEEKIFAESY